MTGFSLWVEAGRLAVAATLGILAGWPFGAPGWGLAAAILGILLWHLLQWRKIQSWWQARDRFDRLPQLPPIWQAWPVELKRLRAHGLREAKLRKRLQQQFDALSVALPDAVVVVNQQLQIEWHNKAAETLLGLYKGDYGHTLTHMVRDPELGQYLRSGDFSLPLELDAFADTPHPISVKVLSLDHHTLMVNFMDLTHGLRLDRLRQEFIANVSHEIKSPLTVVTGYLETLSERPDEPPDPDILRTMSRQCQRMRRLTEDLLELSRLEASDLPEAHLQSITVSALAGEVMNEAKDLTTDIMHEILLDGESTVTIQGNMEELHSAVFNLVSNALHYSPEGSPVTIRWRQKKQTVRLSVIDHGVGIPKDQIARITERFYRVDKARSRDTGGTGLGLAIVKHILHRHKAYLQITSKQGKGSVFTCVFPILQSPYSGKSPDP